MPQVDDTLELQAGSAVTPGRPADDALLTLLASMACSDGEVHDKELDFLVSIRRDLGSRQAVREWAVSAARPLDPAALAAAITSPDDRFAARMAWKDGELADEEKRDLAELASALTLPDGAVDRVLREMSPDDGKRFTAERILRSLMDVHWDAVQLASGQLCSEDLHAVVPPTAEVVARVGLEKVEVMALCTEGLVARFQEGAAFLAWGELVTYTRGRGLGASVLLHTEDGRQYTLVDQRLSGLCMLLDRLLDLEGKRRQAEAPKIDTLRGE
jgi:DnaJ-domain-containing protein 1